MDKKNINYLEELLYNKDENNIISLLCNVDKPLILHFFAANYNWNDGFKVPGAIIKNKHCDFGTGLLIFHYADGFRMLENPEEVSNSLLEEWKDFLLNLYHKLINRDFKTQNISFEPELSKVQIYKIKKNNPNISDLILNQSPGVLVEIPKI